MSNYSGEALIFIKPKGKGRPQFNRKTGNVYTPKRTREYEQELAKHLKDESFERIPKNVPIRLVIAYGLPILKKNVDIDSDGDKAPVKPDIDNLEKSVVDAMQLAGILEDDCCVTTTLHFKRYASDPYVKISWCEDEDGNQ